MTKVKLCGLTRECDIEAVNELKPEYIGFVFAKKSKRYVSPEKAQMLKNLLNKDIQAVGVFVNEDIQEVAKLLNNNIIDLAQLHGNENEEYIKSLRNLTNRKIIKAFKITGEEDIKKAEQSSADFVLLDSGAGTGQTFNWSLIKNINREYFLAGGLSPDNEIEAIETLHPYALDVSSGIETDGFKDKDKMTKFVNLRKDV